MTPQAAVDWLVDYGQVSNRGVPEFDESGIFDSGMEPFPRSRAEAVQRAVAAGVQEIICEVDRIDQIEPALQAGATRLLLDNMGPAVLREAVALVAGRVPTEASGGIDLDTIHAKAATGVDYVSVGRLTQSAPAADIGLDFTPL